MEDQADHLAAAYVVTESEIFTSLVLATICGVGVIVIFMAVRGVMGVYQKRMEIADMDVRTRRLKLGGWSQIWNFLIPSLVVTEEELLMTAGLDALVLLRSMALGVQLFLPLSVIGCAVLLPVYLSGHAVDDGAASGSAFGNSLMYLSLANLAPGAHLYWLVTAILFLFSAYTVWLLNIHFQSLALLRLQYLMHIRPMRKAGDHGFTRLIGPDTMERLGPDSKGRLWRVFHELINPVAMYTWGLKAWDRTRESEHWAQTPGAEAEAAPVGEPNCGSGSRTASCGAGLAAARGGVPHHAAGVAAGHAAASNGVTGGASPGLAGFAPLGNGIPGGREGLVHRGVWLFDPPAGNAAASTAAGPTAVTAPAAPMSIAAPAAPTPIAAPAAPMPTSAAVAMAGLAAVAGAGTATGNAGNAGVAAPAPGAATTVVAAKDGASGGRLVLALGRSVAQDPDVRVGEDGAFERHRATWNSCDPIALITGDPHGAGLFPWWLDQHEQPPVLVDDANMVLLGKTLVRRRQAVPAVSQQRETLQLRNQEEAPARELPMTPNGGGDGPKVQGRCDGQRMPLMWQDREPDVKANVFHYAVLIQCQQNPKPEQEAVRLVFHKKRRRRPSAAPTPASTPLRGVSDQSGPNTPTATNRHQTASAFSTAANPSAGAPPPTAASRFSASPGSASAAMAGISVASPRSTNAAIGAGRDASHGAASAVSGDSGWGKSDQSQGQMLTWRQQQADELLHSLAAMFPDTFQALVPVYNHQKVDELLMKLDAAMNRVDQERERQDKARQAAAEAHGLGGPDARGAQQQGRGPPGRGGAYVVAKGWKDKGQGGDGPYADLQGRGNGGANSKQVEMEMGSLVVGGGRGGVGGLRGRRRGDASEAAAEAAYGFWLPEAVKGRTEEEQAVMKELMSEVHRLENEVLEAREEAMREPPCHAFFAVFSCAKDARLLANCSIGGRSWSWLWKYRTMRAPSPEDVNWQALWTSSKERTIRQLLMLVPLILAQLFPMGLIAGTLTNLNIALCSNPASTLYWGWYCESDGFWARVAKSLLTGLVPMVLNTFWDTYVMPIVFYLIAQGERAYVAHSEVDQQVTRCFFYFGIINNFLMVVLSGGTFSQIGAWINHTGDHNQTLYAMAQALSGACNYFFNAIIWKTFFTNVFRFCWPHDGTVLFVFFRAVGLHRPKGPRDRMVIRTNPSYRGGRHYGAMFVVFIPGLMYSVINPALLPLCLGYFLTAWFTWKQCILYFYEASHESGGQQFDQVIEGILTTLGFTAVFTGITLITRHAWVCGGLCIILLPLLLRLVRRFKIVSAYNADANYPIEAVMYAPTAVVNPLQYVPPSLRNGATGWYPEQQKVWEKYGLPRYA